METLIGAVIEGALSNALNALAGRGLRTARARSRGRATPESPPAGAFGAAAADIAAYVSGEGHDTGEFRQFLRSPEFLTVLRRLYYSELSGRQKDTIALIREEFLCFAHSSVGDQASDEFLARLFDLLGVATTGLVRDAVSAGILAAHEAMSVARQRALQCQMDGIAQNVAFLVACSRDTVADIEGFVRDFRPQVAFVHSQITPPQRDSARKVPIDDIYVLPKLYQFQVKKAPTHEFVSPDEFLTTLSRAVVLGNPGGGKSTLMEKITHDYALDRDFPVVGWPVVPLLVRLRDYGAAKRRDGCSILQFIERQIATTYQFRDPPQGAIEYVLRTGRALALFDGLDELLDARDRREISSDVEAFANLYPNSPVLTTSREVGYDQAPLSDRMFEVFGLAEFDDTQIRQFAEKWFSLTESSTAEAKKKAEAFVDESAVVEDLRSNPLLLALMCSIYRDENYIPRNRPEIYEKCSQMLLERWDKSRRIVESIPLESHIEALLRNLAHWIYSSDERRSGVSRTQLIEQATDYLVEQRYETRAEAERAAREFIDFCKGRAWVFTDTGSSAETPLFQFTHRTFLEYFTASFLLTKHPTAFELAAKVGPLVEQGTWDVVGQLAYQKQARLVDGAGSYLLDDLIDRAELKAGFERLNLLSFALRCLAFMSPHSRVVKRIAEACVAYLLLDDWGTRDTAAARRRGNGTPLSMLGALTSVSIENRPIVSEALLAGLTSPKTISESSGLERAVSVITLAPHAEILGRPGRFGIQGPAFHFWTDFGDRAYAVLSPAILGESPRSFFLAYTALAREDLPLADVIRDHGMVALFTDAIEPRFRFLFQAPIAARLLPMMRTHAHQGAAWWSSQAATLGAILRTSPPPWFGRGSWSGYPFIGWDLDFIGPEGQTTEETNGDDLFATLVLLGAAVEMSRESADLSARLLRTENPFYRQLAPWLVSRSTGTPNPNTPAILSALDIPDECRAVLADWATGTVSFMRPPRRRRNAKLENGKEQSVRT